ncbi:MAG TPA: MGMT family protein [Candidatus Paceibacterota bacterium]|nr:MGMT family protein [Candidatus Paceibacterota bacterium]
MTPSFTQKVYAVVAKIPKGKTLSYKKVAIRAGSPRAYRAVGNIMNRHNIKGLPCHRVIGSNGKIGGYKYGVKRKIELLKKEGVKMVGSHSGLVRLS